VYDTIYAHMDAKDDVRAGVKSTALLFGPNTRAILTGAPTPMIPSQLCNTTSLMWPFITCLHYQAFDGIHAALGARANAASNVQSCAMQGWRVAWLPVKWWQVQRWGQDLFTTPVLPPALRTFFGRFGTSNCRRRRTAWPSSRAIVTQGRCSWQALWRTSCQRCLQCCDCTQMPAVQWNNVGVLQLVRWSGHCTSVRQVCLWTDDLRSA
jgi:hypothetical protein